MQGMNNYLADTTVLVEHLRGNLVAKTFLEEHTPIISSVSIAELIQGARDNQELTSAITLCSSLPECVIDKKISQRALKLLQNFHLSHGLLFLDALISATALEEKAILITGNVKHFRYIPSLKMIPQEEIFSKLV